jgi:hypothetical protein
MMRSSHVSVNSFVVSCGACFESETVVGNRSTAKQGCHNIVYVELCCL